MENMFDFSLFYYSIFITLALGALSVVCKNQVEKIMEALEEKANGRVAAH